MSAAAVTRRRSKPAPSGGPLETDTAKLLTAIQTLRAGTTLTDAMVTEAVQLMAEASRSGGVGGAAGKLLSSTECVAALVSVVDASSAPDKAASAAGGYAAQALAAVARGGFDGQNTVFAAGGLPPLVRLLRGGDDSDGSAQAARALCALCTDFATAQEQLVRQGGVQPLITMLFAWKQLPAAQEAARALACLAPKGCATAVRHWIRWCQTHELAPLRSAVPEPLPHEADARSFNPDGTFAATTKGEEAAKLKALEQWLVVRFGTWLQQDAQMSAEAAHQAVEHVQSWHFKLFGVYLTETRSEADKGSQREPPPWPPLPPPPSTTNAGAPRKPRFGVEPGLLRDGMTVLLGKGVPAEGAAWKANQRACVTTAFVAMLRGSEVALREEVSWDPALHLTRADLTFEGDGTPEARAVLMTRPVRPVVRETSYRTPHLTAQDLSVRAVTAGRLWLAPGAEDDLPDEPESAAWRARQDMYAKGVKFEPTPLCYDDGTKTVAVYIPAGGTTLDAYQELRTMVEDDPIPAARAAHTPLFRDPRTGGPISVPQLRDLVRALMYAAGKYNASDYGAHSLRVGGASALLSLGADALAIRALARCSHECYALYMKGHAAEARGLTLRASCFFFPKGMRHFDQVAHE